MCKVHKFPIDKLVNSYLLYWMLLNLLFVGRRFLKIFLEILRAQLIRFKYLIEDRLNIPETGNLPRLESIHAQSSLK